MKNNNPLDLIFSQLETLAYYVDDNMEAYQKGLLQELLDHEDYEELRTLNLSLAEYHVIDCIGRDDPVNVTAIAKKLKFTKGGISKITAKLLNKALIEARRRENNQKEIYYSLKPLGFKAFQLHDVLHRKAREDFQTVLTGFNHEELKVISRFLGEFATLFKSSSTGRE